MPTTSSQSDELYDRLVDRLRHAAQYTEAARLMIQDTLDLLEAAKEKEAQNDA